VVTPEANRRPVLPNGTLDNVNNTPNLCGQEVEDGRDLIVVRSVRVGWITLTVPYRYNEFDNGSIPIHFRSRNIRGEREDFCFVFDLPVESGNLKIASEGRHTAEAEILRSEGAIYKHEQSVLVDIVEIAKNSEKRREFFVLANVRLYSLDCCPHVAADVAKRPSVDGIVKPVFGIGDRKHELLSDLVGEGIRGALMDRNGVNKVIKCGSEVTETVGRHEGQTLESGGLIDPNNQAMAGAVRVSLLDKAIRVSVVPSADFVIDGLSVFLTPRKLRSNGSEIEIEHRLPCNRGMIGA
jgi:hypothetical protein